MIRKKQLNFNMIMLPSHNKWVLENQTHKYIHFKFGINCKTRVEFRVWLGRVVFVSLTKSFSMTGSTCFAFRFDFRVAKHPAGVWSEIWFRKFYYYWRRVGSFVQNYFVHVNYLSPSGNFSFVCSFLYWYFDIVRFATSTKTLVSLKLMAVCSTCTAQA